MAKYLATLIHICKRICSYGGIKRSGIFLLRCDHPPCRIISPGVPPPEGVAYCELTNRRGEVLNDGFVQITQFYVDLRSKLNMRNLSLRAKIFNFGKGEEIIMKLLPKKISV